MRFEQLFIHQPSQPLLFNSGTFMLLFSGLVLAYALLAQRGRARGLLLLSFSVLYYYKCNGALVATLLITTAADFTLARAIHRCGSQRVRSALLALSIGLSLSILGYFKYANFLLENAVLITGASHRALAIALPVGISFYTFQSIAYVVDVYRGRLEPSDSLLEYALFLALFPQVVAGPIVRASELLPQLRARPLPSRDQVAEGMQRIVAGLCKKALLADYLGCYSDLIFGSPASYHGPEVVLAVYAYALQIYFDFSGYSDMAIGMGRVLGLQLPENFEGPYRAVDISEFWRRWHMTLSRWVRDYLFMPLSLRAGGRMAWRYAALLLAMTLVGLWHGAAWRFVLWGALHGVALALHAWVLRRRRDRQPARPPPPRWRRALGWLATLHFVVASWVIFRADGLSSAVELFTRAANGWELDRCLTVLDVRSPVVIAVLLGAVIALAPRRWHADGARVFVRAPALAKALVFVVVVQSVLQVQTADVQPFIYFQF